MIDNVKQILKSPFGSIYTTFTKEQIKSISSNLEKKVAVTGSIQKPGIIEINESISLKKIVEKAGGIVNNNRFKAAQLGIPFGGFYTKKDYDKKINLLNIDKNTERVLIILSEGDCIIQYAIFYLEYILGRMEKGYLESFISGKAEIERMLRLLNRISKGKSNMRDVFLLRQLTDIIKTKTGMGHNLVQEVIENFYEEIKEHIEENRCYTLQCNNLTKLTITEKCVGCGKCKTVCPVDCIIGSIKKQHYIDYVRCTHCGACLSICPVKAITAGDNSVKFLRDLATPGKIVITQMAPAVRVAIGEAFGIDSGENVEGKISAALRKIGVNYVFDTTWAADLIVMEEAKEFQLRLESYLRGDKNIRLPILTSCCPAWIKFIEQNYGDMLDIPSTVKSPMMAFAAIAKDIWAKEKNIPRNKLISVSIMPCIAKKYEASRNEFSRGLNFDVDYVITTNELIEIFKETNIDLCNIEEKEIDKVMGEYTGAGIIFGRTGGVIEATLRTAVENITGERLQNIEFRSLRGWDSFRSCEVEINGLKIKIGVTYGLKEAGLMLDKIRSGEEFYHAIEIMACVGGCVGGGGQPRSKKRIETIKERAEGLDKIDKSLNLRVSKDNPAVKHIYEKYLDYPMSNKALELLHTKYFLK